MNSVLQFFVLGGFFMIPLLICSIVAVTIVLLRGFALKEEAVIPSVLCDSVEKLQPDSDPEQITRLSRLVSGDPSPLAKVIRVGLQHLAWPKSENTEAVQTRARHEIVRLEKGLIVLEVIVGIAPLLGLLGTVSGLVKVFATLGSSQGVPDPQSIASGIAEALNTTVAGLAIAVPSLIAFSYFSKKIEMMTIEMESLVADLLTKCYHQKIRFPNPSESGRQGSRVPLPVRSPEPSQPPGAP